MIYRVAEYFFQCIERIIADRYTFGLAGNLPYFCADNIVFQIGQAVADLMMQWACKSFGYEIPAGIIGMNGQLDPGAVKECMWFAVEKHETCIYRAQILNRSTGNLHLAT